jgi:hypothetical protein
MAETPAVALLGICDRTNLSSNLTPHFASLNIIGLRNDVIGFIYPGNLGRQYLLFALYDLPSLVPAQIYCESRRVPADYNFTIHLEAEELKGQPSHALSSDVARLTPFRPWIISVVEFPETHRTILEPDCLDFYVIKDGQKSLIGDLRFLYAKAPPLTSETIMAIKNSPRSSRFGRISLECRKCNDKLLAYTGIERAFNLESSGHVWYQDLGDFFTCGCGSTRINLQFLRSNFHAMLGEPVGSGSEEGYSLTRLYEESAISSIRDKFEVLLAQGPPEEEIQKFIEDNPILLHRFAADRIIPKASILAKYKTDFAIQSKTGELFLIEIEHSRHKLLLKNGGRTAAFNHAFDQANDWLRLAATHRVACLDMLGIKHDAVSAVRGVVIMGRDRDHDAAQLQQLKGTDFGQIAFYTYDDLLGGLGSLINDVKRI